MEAKWCCLCFNTHRTVVQYMLEPYKFEYRILKVSENQPGGTKKVSDSQVTASSAVQSLGRPALKVLMVSALEVL